MKVKKTRQANTRITLTDAESKALKTLLVFSHEIKTAPYWQAKVDAAEWVARRLCATSIFRTTKVI